MSNTIDLDVYKNTLKRSAGFAPVSGERGYSVIVCHFKQDDDWDNITVLNAGFYVSEKDIVRVSMTIDNTDQAKPVASVTIPTTLLEEREPVYFGLIGSYSNSSNSVRIATNVVRLDVAHGIVGGEPADEEVLNKWEELMTAINAGFALKEDKNNKVTSIENAESITDYPSVKGMKDYVSGRIANKADKATTLAGYGITDAYTKAQTNNLLDGKANASHTHSQYLTAHQDISGKEDKSNKIQDYLPAQITTEQKHSHYPSVFTTESIIDDKLAEFLLSEVPFKTSDLTNDSGFLTQHQDISGKLDKLAEGTANKIITSTAGGAVQRSIYSASSTASNITNGEIAILPTCSAIKEHVAGVISQITEPYNLYDPCAAYTVTDASQTGKVGYSVDSGTGSITVTRAQGDGQKYIRYADKTLKAGTYTLSGKVTLHSNAADGNRTMCCNIGYEKTRQQVNLTTERGGSQNIGSSDKEGWFSCTVTLSYDQVFSFEAIPWSTTVCNSNLPAVLSNVQIIEGADIGAYSPAARTSVDIKARTLIGKRGDELAANTTALKNRNGVIYTTASARHKFELLNNSGLKVTIGAGLNTKLAGDHAELNWDTISTAMPSGSFSTATGDKAIITMSSQTALVYNTSDGKLHLRDVSVSTESNFYPDDILLVLNGAGTPLKGLIFDEYIRRSAEDRAIDNDFAVTIPVVANGTVSVVNGVTEYSYSATRIRTNWIYFSAGDTITINSGSLRHAIQIWHGKTRTSANVPSSYRSRNIGAYTAATESLTFDYDGTMVVIFTNANNSALSVDDFDGSIKHYRFASRRTQEMLDTALNGINFSIVSKASPLYYNVFNGYFYKGQPITISYSRTDSAVNSLQPHFIKKDGTSFAPASPYHQIAPNTTVTFTLSDDAVMMYTYCGNGENCSATITAPPLSKFLGDKINELSQTYTDIVTLNKDALARLDEAKTFVKRRGRTDTYTPTFALLHFSDIHGATTALTRLVELKNHLGSKLSDTICTGDMVNDKYEDTMSFWDGVTGAGSILTCIGNHDVHHQGESSYTADQIGQTDTYTRYFAPYKDGWGVTIGENLTYYYKDYPTNKVRLIALNYLLTGDEATAQNTWLQARLAEAKTNGYTVIIATHCQLQNSNAVDCSFTTFGKTTFGGQLDESYQASVQSFINDGGLFACYISGHTHWDAVAYNSNYPNQLCITVTTASVNMNDNDQPRISGTITQDAANLIVIDVDFKVVKIIRVGANIDTYLRGRNTLTYSYDTHSVLSELPTTQGVLYGNTSN